MKTDQDFQNKITDLIQKELSKFPQAQPVDIYKLFYQDYFGPGHFFSDKNNIIISLIRELDEFSDPTGSAPGIQEIGCLNNFIRVDIRWITWGNFTIEEMADLFWRSSRLELFQPLPWHEHWENITKIIIREYNGLIKNDKNKLDDFARQKTGVHHSEIYRQNYQPHYRIISKAFWKL
ncbi:MAG: hypothetical protein K9M99_01245 [Candidatus Cloacimonetes bacterium]|nr:hypothetical protein [Candidatus Cloacimonadota bacterium]